MKKPYSKPLKWRCSIILGLFFCSALSVQAQTEGSNSAVVLPSLEEVPQRIVVIRSACMMPEVLAAFGAQERLVQGLCMRFGPEDLLLKIAPSYKALQPLFPTEGLINMEEVLKARPDFAFISADLKNAQALRLAGLNVAVVNSSTRDYRDLYRLAGAVLNDPKRSKELLDYSEALLTRLRNRLAQAKNLSPKSALYVQGTRPLNVMGNDSFNAFMIELAGGSYASKDFTGSFMQISSEQLLAWNPQVVFVSPKDKLSKEDLLTKPEWQGLQAVKNKDVYAAPLGAFFWDKPSAEGPLYVLWLSGVFYPELFPKSELIDETKTFFDRFFGYKLTETELANIIP